MGNEVSPVPEVLAHMFCGTGGFSPGTLEQKPRDGPCRPLLLNPDRSEKNILETLLVAIEAQEVMRTS